MNTRLLFQLYTLIVAAFFIGCGSRDGHDLSSSVDSGPDVPLPEVLRQAAALEEVAFSDIIQASTGRKILPLGRSFTVAASVLAEVFNEVLTEMNLPGSPIRGLRRINEASRFFEDAIRTRIDQHADFQCHVPPNAEGTPQRTGYPDLRIVHLPTNSVFYLDPKLYETGSEDSSLRTFYYTPNSNRTKVLEDAHHLLVGFAHDGNDGQWRFLRWRLVDLSQLTVRLKTEIQASNRDLYQNDSLILESSLGSGDPQRRD
ncbi:MAG: hypothetical protein AAGJ79_06635 [Verrucomicrobiota bacterium]